MTARLTLKRDGGSTKSREETCIQFRQDREPTCKQLRRQRRTKPIGRREIGILSILHAMTTGVFFSQSWDRFRLPGEKPPANRRGCEQYTHKYSTYRVHSMITFHHANTRGSGAKLRIAHLCVPNTIVIHVPCLVLCRT